jgi:hypothetical protein
MADISTLQNDLSSHFNEWTDVSSGGSASIVGGKLKLNCGTAGGHFAAIVTDDFWNIIGSNYRVRVTMPGSLTGVLFQCFIRDASDDYVLVIEVNDTAGGTIAQLSTTGTHDSEAYSATDNKWIGHTGDADELFWQSAADDGAGPASPMTDDFVDAFANHSSIDFSAVKQVFLLLYVGTANVEVEIEAFNTNVAGGGAASITAILSAYGEY